MAPMASLLVTMANALLGVLPAALVFFLAYGRYDGAFRDNVVFIYFIGGLLTGGFLGFALLLVLGNVLALIAVVLLGLLLPVGMTAAINRRKWQGERHAIFNGGSFGLGMAVMLAFTWLYFRVTLYRRSLAEAGHADVEAGVTDLVISLPHLGQGLLLTLGFTGLFFALGLLVGDGVRRRAQLRTALLGTATILAPMVFLEELYKAWSLGTAGAWIWAALFAAYAGIYGFAAERRLLVQGVSDEARRQRRRLRRQKLQQGE